MDEAVQEENQQEILPEIIVDFPLPIEMIASSLGLLLKGLFGEGYMYTRIMLNEKKLTDIENLRSYINLFYVNISKNYLENINALEKMTYMLTLDASFNRISDIVVIASHQFLSEVNLAKNNIETLPKIDMPLLKKLNLNYNKISRLTDDNGDYLIRGNLIKTLEIRNNLLTSTVGINLPWLANLYAAGNQITEIKDLKDHNILELIHLRGNKIEVLDGLVENIPKLKYLNLRQNKISNIEEVKKLAIMESLSHLVLRENTIEEDEDYRIAVLKCVPHLKRLDKTEYEDEDRELLKVEMNPEDQE